MSQWIHACAVDDIEEEDLIAWGHDGQRIAIYRTDQGIFATDLMCTHEDQSLEDGLVMDCVIECPLHNGRFDIRTGKALSAPVSVDLKTYPTRIDAGQIWVDVG